jgi:hypothetical protein
MEDDYPQLYRITLALVPPIGLIEAIIRVISEKGRSL